MSKSDAELRAQLLAQAEVAIDQMLRERKAPGHASLADTLAPAASAGVEQVARTAGQRVAQAVTSALAAESAAELPPWPNCPQCGKKLKHKGKHRRRVVTETGEIELDRAYYHCAACRQGIFPPGPPLGDHGGGV